MAVSVLGVLLQLNLPRTVALIVSGYQEFFECQQRFCFTRSWGRNFDYVVTRELDLADLTDPDLLQIALSQLSRIYTTYIVPGPRNYIVCHRIILKQVYPWNQALVVECGPEVAKLAVRFKPPILSSSEYRVILDLSVGHLGTPAILQFLATQGSTLDSENLTYALSLPNSQYSGRRDLYLTMLAPKLELVSGHLSSILIRARRNGYFQFLNYLGRQLAPSCDIERITTW